MNSNLKNWLESLEYLPKFLRDFHDQKDIFKVIHHIYSGNSGTEEMPNWISAHMYTIDWFLWYMASRGYTLQKCKKNLEFKNMEDDLKSLEEVKHEMFSQMLDQAKKK